MSIDDSPPGIAIALLTQRIEALIERIDARDARFDALCDDHESRLRRNEHDITALQQRQGLWGGALAALSLASSTIAAWLGSR